MVRAAMARAAPNSGCAVTLRGGVYTIKAQQPLTITPADSFLTIRSYAGEVAGLSGAVPLGRLNWVKAPAIHASGARFPTEMYTLGCHCMPALVRLKLFYACDQWHSARNCTPLTGLHCTLRPNTEGLVEKLVLRVGVDGQQEAKRAVWEMRQLFGWRYGARFWQKSTLEDAIGSHACSLEAFVGE
jgi:hypothetical protein